MFASLALLFHGVDVSGSLRMIAAGNDQLHLGHSFGKNVERLNHQFQPFVCPPFSERQDAVNRISAPFELRKFRTPGQDAMGPQVNIVATIFIVENFPVARHEDRN